MSTNITTQPPQQVPGLTCPRCKVFIQTSIVQLISSRTLYCPHCQLQLRINQAQSHQAIEALKKIHLAQENVERKSKF